MVKRIVGVILILSGLAVFVPGLYGAVSLYCVVHFVPPYGEAAAGSPLALFMIRTLTVLAQILVVVLGVVSLVSGSRTGDTEQRADSASQQDASVD